MKSSKEKDQFGLVFARWGGWKYEGECEFRVGQIARTGKYSCLLKGGMGAKIRVGQNVTLEPGRYRVTAYLRGLDIGTGNFGWTTEFMFNGKYHQLNKNGTFGWTKLTYVGEVEMKKEAGPSFGLMALGYLWIDDVSLEPVDANVPLSDQPVIDHEERSIAAPGVSGTDVVRCSECGYRNDRQGKTCYACGTRLEATQRGRRGPESQTHRFLRRAANPFSGGVVVATHATTGRNALRIDRSYVSLDQPQDWLGYDFLKADLFTDARKPMNLDVEIRDTATRDYWTRVNYSTVVPPGQEHADHPGQATVCRREITARADAELERESPGWCSASATSPPAPLFWIMYGSSVTRHAARVSFEGLHAFDFGTGTSPVMEGFTADHAGHPV